MCARWNGNSDFRARLFVRRICSRPNDEERMEKWGKYNGEGMFAFSVQKMKKKKTRCLTIMESTLAFDRQQPTEINGLCAKMVAEVIYLFSFPSILQMASGGSDFVLYLCVPTNNLEAQCGRCEIICAILWERTFNCFLGGLNQVCVSLIWVWARIENVESECEIEEQSKIVKKEINQN